jgi:hypothetical protein
MKGGVRHSTNQPKRHLKEGLTWSKINGVRKMGCPAMVVAVKYESTFLVVKISRILVQQNVLSE